MAETGNTIVQKADQEKRQKEETRTFCQRLLDLASNRSGDNFLVGSNAEFSDSSIEILLNS